MSAERLEVTCGCGATYVQRASWDTMCEPCRVRRNAGQFTPVRVPFRVKGGGKDSRLTGEGFASGYETLASYWRMPAQQDARMAFYYGVRSLSDAEFQSACRDAVSKLDRRPNPQWLVDAARSKRASAGVEVEPEYEFGWLFLCHGCGYQMLSPSDVPDPPTLCGKCARKVGEQAVAEAAW